MTKIKYFLGFSLKLLEGKNSKEVCMYYVEVKYLELIKIEKSVNH